MALIHNWRLDNSAVDSAGDKNGTASNVTYAPKRIQGTHSGLFNGTSSYVDIPAINHLSYTGFSVSAWYYYISGNSRCIFSINNTSSSDTWKIVKTSATSLWVTTTTSELIGVSTTTNTWAHVVATDTNGTVALYVNGKLIKGPTNIGRGSWTPNNTQIGNTNRFGGRAEFWNGYIDDVRFYDTALTAAQVRALYNSYFTPTGLGMSQQI